MRLFIVLVVLIPVGLGCAGETGGATAPLPAVTVATAPLPSPLPAGRWHAERPERTSCIDCPTPRVAVVLATGTLDDLSERRWPESAGSSSIRSGARRLPVARASVS